MPPIDRELFEKALETLEGIQWPGSPSFVKAAIIALRDRLAQPEHEPVQKPAAVVSSCTGAGDKGVRVKWLGGFPQIGDRLYTAPPQPEQCQYPDCKCATENPCLKGLAQPQRTHWEGCEEVHPECRKPEQSVAGYCKKIEELIAERDELRERLEQPEQEPVAWRYQDARGNYRYRGYVQGFDKEYSLLKPVPLYTRPNPQQGNRHG